MTRHESLFALHYGRRYGTRISRLWGRLAALLKIVEFFGGSSAFGGYLAGHAAFAGYAGLVVAAAAAINYAVDPREKQLAAIALREKFALAIKEAAGISDKKLEERVLDLQATPILEIEALRMPVYIETCGEMGLPHEGERRGFWGTIVGAFA
ncbi:hypothetical protein CNECB9_560044 [Cupriavidus necator]|uniref:Uncharacterized protein n=1 Tax=Cupriavidus necator TaxID=106590 RepID=A0A1K0JL53_CUPNE|nr:hypothetical protein CNECB9_560044 [Cupriavidus necator]